MKARSAEWFKALTEVVDAGEDLLHAYKYDGTPMQDEEELQATHERFNEAMKAFVKQSRKG